MSLMQVREAANSLGVHENTLRRWEERGLVDAVKLPSGVRRFRSEDIELLREDMYKGLAPLKLDTDIAKATSAKSVD